MIEGEQKSYETVKEITKAIMLNTDALWSHFFKINFNYIITTIMKITEYFPKRGKTKLKSKNKNNLDIVLHLRSH